MPLVKPAVVPVITILAAGAVLAAPPAKKPAAKPLTAAQKAQAAAAKKAKAAAAARAAAAKRALSRTQPQSLGSRGGSPVVRPSPGDPDKIGEPFVPAPAPQAGGSELPQARIVGAPMFFRTGADYDIRLDLKPDFVAVQRPAGAWGEWEAAGASWKAAGYPVYRLLSLAQDPGAFYTSGKAGGEARPDEVDRDAASNPLGDAERPFVTLTRDWIAHLKEQVRRGVDAGSDGFVLGDLGLPSAGGYSPAFEKLWKDTLGMPWQAPVENPGAFYRASRLKSDLALAGVNELLRQARDLARERSRPTRFLLSLPSPLAASEGGRIFPWATASRLPVDGLVGELPLAPAPMLYEGVAGAHTFEADWLSASYFANLVDGLADRPLFLSAASGGPDAKRSWAEYETRYKQAVAASLVFPQVRGFEQAPWPEWTFGSQAPSTPPPPYLTQLSGLSSVLKELPAEGSDVPNRIGVLALDSLAWQRGGPGGSSAAALEGLTLPLLKRGVPVQLVPAERVADANFLSRYRVLLLSYDMQKPQGPEVNQGLAQWVRAGGTLVVVGGEEPYNSVDEWWQKNGFASPTDHLLRQCGAAVDLIQRGLRQPSTPYKKVLEATDQVQDPQTHTVVLRSEVEAGKPFHLRFQDRSPDAPGGLRLRRVRILEGQRVRADFTPGSVAERPFLAEETGTRTAAGERAVDGRGIFSYRFQRLGEDARMELEVGGDFLVTLAGGDPGATLKPALAPLAGVRVPSHYPVVTYPMTGAQPLYTAQAGSQEITPAWVSGSGQGSVLYCGVPPSFAAESPAGAEMLRSLVRYACGRAGVEYAEGPLLVRRGPYVVAHSGGRTMSLEGQYLDLFKPDFPLVQNPQLPYREPGFYRQVRLNSRFPMVLVGTHRVRTLEANGRITRLLLDGPTGTQGLLRVFNAGMSLTGVEARTTDGQLVNMDIRPDGRTLRIRYPQSARGVNLTLRWVRPEARLTK